MLSLRPEGLSEESGQMYLAERDRFKIDVDGWGVWGGVGFTVWIMYKIV